MKIVINGESVEIPSVGGSSIPSGGIIIWSGAADAIPDGWALCDGENNTPDLRDKFVLGGGATHAVGATGGEETHTLTTNEMPQHTHSINTSTSGGSVGGYIRYTASLLPTNPDSYLVSTMNAGGSKPHNNMPPYYTLCYIMKL